ncbi:MAG: sigma-54 dependent transcriptional regulator [Gemmatimonadaceae bacterium]|jgi:two-component system response regulator HydG|nr:sigma-54 dependent transcriptional regulator [Gemmatimonadaceae bacterium]
MTSTPRVLVVEDDAALRALLTELLASEGYDVHASTGGRDALAHLAQHPDIGVVLTDLLMPDGTGEELLRAVAGRQPALRVIVMTAFGSIESAVRLVRAGAFDYLTKPVTTTELLRTVARAVTDQPVSATTAHAPGTPGSGELVARSAIMKEVLGVVDRVARATHPVLFTGESGVGKEVLARRVHERSGRGPFVAVNCAAIPDASVEAELFGHARGAFPGAERERAGLFEAANGGTLFLDEVAELPLSVQPRLLRALESGEVRRMGDATATTFDVRVLAATHHDLESEMREGRFREDLYWRLAVLQIEVPPLRDRPDDIEPLAEQLLAEASGGRVHRLDGSARRALLGYGWPGNVRELRNAMQRAATLATSNHVAAGDLPPRVREGEGIASLIQRASQELLPLEAVERAYVLDVLKRADGNKTRAAEILGLDRKTLYRKLTEWAAGSDGEGQQPSS